MNALSVKRWKKVLAGVRRQLPTIPVPNDPVDISLHHEKTSTGPVPLQAAFSFLYAAYIEPYGYICLRI